MVYAAHLGGELLLVYIYIYIKIKQKFIHKILVIFRLFTSNKSLTPFDQSNDTHNERAL